MSVVTQATYESLSEKIGNAFGAQKGTIPYIASGLAEVLVLDDADQEYDLLASWYTSNVNAGTAFNDPGSFLALATALNTHAEIRSGKTLTTFLTDESISVSSNYAIVSKAAGWDIDAYIA